MIEAKAEEALVIPHEEILDEKARFCGNSEEKGGNNGAVSPTWTDDDTKYCGCNQSQ